MTAWARRGVPPLGAALLVLVIAGAAGATTLTFASAVTLGSGTTPESVVIGDLNQDGTPDLAIANQHSNSVSVLLGIGTAPGTFQPKVDYTTGLNSGPVSVAIGDLNHDGTPDLATANQGLDTVSVLLGIGAAPGTFQTHADYTTGPGTGFGSAPVSVAIGDLNRDGTPDLVTANQNGSAVSVLLGNGGGTFQAHADYTTGSLSLPASVAIGDLNHDGNPDLAVADSNFDKVVVLLGNGATPGATLQPHIDYTVGADPHSVAIGDLNNDGTPDLATANCCANSVSVLLGVGNGTFQAHADYTTGPGTGFGSAPYSVAIGDLNNDGTPDLATANTNADNVSVLLGIGTAPGTFQAHTDYAVGDAPLSVAIGDLDADGALDLAVANSVASNVSVLFQRSAPGAPGSVSATAGNGQATVSFTTPPTNGGGPISSYTVTASPGGATATGAASPLTVAGLTNGSAYTFTVTATNGAGTGSASAASNTAIPGLPGAPTGVTASANNTQATVGFTAPPSNGSAISSYTVTASPGGATATGAASPLTVAGLSNGTAYTFTVTATNAVGTGSASAASNTITPVAAASSTTPPAQPATAQPETVDTIAPTPPAGLTGRFTNGALILRWQPSTDSVGIDHYELYLGGIPVQRIAGSVTQASVRIFNPAGTSLYTVRALDAAGNQSAVLAAVTVRPVGRPTSLPGRIPQWAWQLLAWQETGDDGARPKTPAKLPQWYARWKAWRLQPFRLAS